MLKYIQPHGESKYGRTWDRRNCGKRNCGEQYTHVRTEARVSKEGTVIIGNK